LGLKQLPFAKIAE